MAWQIGTYTRVSQPSTKSSSAEKRMRSAKAPTISAGVMIAKVIWKAKNSASGIVPFKVCGPTPARKARSSPPTNERRLVTPACMPVVSKAML